MTSQKAVLGMEQGGFGYGAKRVFTGVSVLLDDAITGLVGANGAGKSTLLRCLSGELELNAGKLVRSRNLQVGFLPQETAPELGDLTVSQVLKRALERGGSAGEDWRIGVLLEEIGLEAVVAEAPFGSLSGGWRRLVLIAALARLQDPDILILDEPTNHLDLANIAVLERWLTGAFHRPMLIVSHDRDFLNRVTQRTLFMRKDGVRAFGASFSRARAELLRLDAADAVRRRLEDTEIRRLQTAAARYRVWAMKNPALGRRARAVETRVAHKEARLTAVHRPQERRLALSGAPIEAKVVLRLEGWRVDAPQSARPLLTVDQFNLAAGDRVALLGANGAGKSTLLGALAAAYAARPPHPAPGGAVRFNPAARLAFFDQHLSDPPPWIAPLDYLLGVPGVDRQDAVRHLVQAGFALRRMEEPVSAFSPGERTRLAFLKMKLAAPNLYLLDEPTNHLDIEGQEALEEELERSEVACLLVSHDRYFVRTAATRFVEIRRNKLFEVDDPEAFFDAEAARGLAPAA